MRLDATAGIIVQPLPSISTPFFGLNGPGQTVIIKETSGGNGVTAAAAGGDTIRGVTAIAAGTAGVFISDGVSVWDRIS